MASNLSRRRFLGFAAGASCLGVLGCSGKSGRGSLSLPEREAWVGTPKGPRYVVQLLLSGGPDPVYTLDPKEAGEVEEGIDLPENNAFASSGNVRVGVHFRPLEKHLDKLSVLRGVQVGTANHDTGIKQFSRLKTRTTDVMPSVLDIIGSARDTQALGVVNLSTLFRTAHSPKFFGTADPFYYGPDDVFAIAEQHKDEGPALAAQLRREASGLMGRSKSFDAMSRLDRVTLANLLETADFLERLPSIPEFKQGRTHSDYTHQSMSNSFDRALWLIKNDLARCVHADLGLLGWDTHIRNEPRQKRMNGAFVTSFSRFIAALESQSNEHGNLLENTLIIAGADIGRFPKLNAMNGKDHLPQTNFFFAGHGIAAGTAHGQTDGLMKAVPMSLKTGKAEGGGHIPLVDDIGTTVLRHCGFDPEIYGYAGKTIECILS